MGLGKTLTMISLALKHRELEEERAEAGKKGAAPEKEESEWLGKKSGKGFVRSKVRRKQVKISDSNHTD